MTWCRAGWMVTLLLVAGIAVGAYEMVVVGDVEPGSDGRRMLRLTPAEREGMLNEMRGFLVAVQRILEAAERGDMAAVAAAAREMGGAQGCGVEGPAARLRLMAKLPLEFKRLGRDTHRRFDDLAREAEESGDPRRVRRRLTELMGNCIACHAGYGISASAPLGDGGF